MIRKLAALVLPAALLLSLSATAVADEKAGDGTAKSQRATSSSSSKTMSVHRLVLANGISGHEPQAATSFATSNDRIYAFVEVENPGGDDSISVVFEPPSGPAFAEIPLKVSGGAAHFRTWAFTRRAHEAGEWAVVIRDAHDKLLSRQTFTITK